MVVLKDKFDATERGGIRAITSIKNRVKKTGK